MSQFLANARTAAPAGAAFRQTSDEASLKLWWGKLEAWFWFPEFPVR